MEKSNTQINTNYPNTVKIDGREFSKEEWWDLAIELDRYITREQFEKDFEEEMKKKYQRTLI